MSSDIWNPWHGCRKYSEGCDHCYMHYLDNERGKSGGEIYKVKTNSDLLLNFVFKLYHKTCEQFYRNFGLYEKSPNSFSVRTSSRLRIPSLFSGFCPPLLQELPPLL